MSALPSARAMTDTPDLPPATSAGLPVPPMTPPSLPPGTPAGRPRIWQAAAAVRRLRPAWPAARAPRSCRRRPHARSAPSDLWAFLFVASMPFAAGAFALLVFRLWRRRVAEAWPSLGQAALMGLAGAVARRRRLRRMGDDDGSLRAPADRVHARGGVRRRPRRWRSAPVSCLSIAIARLMVAPRK